MKVRGKVKLLCEYCKKVVVRLTRDKHYVYVTCTKNPRHKQRTKFQTFSTQTAAASRSNEISMACLPYHPFLEARQQDFLKHQRGLLGQRQTASIGETMWRAATAF